MTENSTKRVRRKRALDADATTYHARGQILAVDAGKFNAMVNRAKSAVEKALKGESDGRDSNSPANVARDTPEVL